MAVSGQYTESFSANSVLSRIMSLTLEVFCDEKTHRTLQFLLFEVLHGYDPHELQGGRGTQSWTSGFCVASLR